MNIWILTSELPSEYAGGIARYVENFAKIAGENGHKVTIIARSQEKVNKEIHKNVNLIGVVTKEGLVHAVSSEDPVKHPAFPYNILNFWDAFSYHMAEEVIELLKTKELPDVIEVQEYGAVGYYLQQRKLIEDLPLKNIPIVVHLHSSWFETAKINQEPLYKLPYYWIGQMEKFSIFSADALISPSHFIADSLKKSLKKDFHIETFPLPTLVEKKKIRENFNNRDIIYFGRLEIRKGVLPLIKSCVKLWEKGEDFRLILIGGDTEYFPKNMSVGAFIKERYKKWIDSGRLILKNQMKHEELVERLRDAWAVTIPSLWENFPNTCIEAMSVGQVVLVSKSGGQAEMVEEDGKNGFIFDWEKEGDFEDKLLKILNLSIEEKIKIGKNAQERIYKFCDPKTVLEQRINHFKKVISNYKPKEIFPTTYDVPPAPKNLKKFNQIKDLLSVVIPYYNLGKLLEETLDSVLNSTYKNLEIIIVNDGSTDEESLNMLKKIEKRGLENVRVLTTSNQGLASARNNGAKEAKGEFLAFIDADDLIDSRYFEKAIKILKKYKNVSFVYSWVQYFENSNDVWPTYNAEFPYMLGHNMLNANFVLKYDEFMNKGLNKKIMEYSLEDFEAWISIMEKGGVGVSIPQILTKYRIRKNSMYRQSNKNQIYYLYQLITQLHSSLYQQYGVELFNLQNVNGPAFAWIHPSADMTQPPNVYVEELKRKNEELYKECKRLAEAWEIHNNFIQEQTKYINSLENQISSLTKKNLNNNIVLEDGELSWREYELGAKIVKKIKGNFLVKVMLKNPKIKDFIKKMVKRFV